MSREKKNLSKKRKTSITSENYNPNLPLIDNLINYISYRCHSLLNNGALEPSLSRMWDNLSSFCGGEAIGRAYPVGEEEFKEFCNFINHLPQKYPKCIQHILERTISLKKPVLKEDINLYDPNGEMRDWYIKIKKKFNSFLQEKHKKSKKTHLDLIKTSILTAFHLEESQIPDFDKITDYYVMNYLQNAIVKLQKDKYDPLESCNYFKIHILFERFIPTTYRLSLLETPTVVYDDNNDPVCFIHINSTGIKKSTVPVKLKEHLNRKIKILAGNDEDEIGFISIDVTGKGNCLYHAIEHQLIFIRQAPFYNHQELRKISAERIKANPTFTPIQELTSIEKVGVWVEEPVISSLAEALNICIKLKCHNINKILTYGDETKPTIYIYYNGTDHYQSLIPLSKLDAPLQLLLDEKDPIIEFLNPTYLISECFFPDIRIIEVSYVTIMAPLLTEYCREPIEEVEPGALPDKASLHSSEEITEDLHDPSTLLPSIFINDKEKAVDKKSLMTNFIEDFIYLNNNVFSITPDLNFNQKSKITNIFLEHLFKENAQSELYVYELILKINEHQPGYRFVKINLNNGADLDRTIYELLNILLSKLKIYNSPEKKALMTVANLYLENIKNQHILKNQEIRRKMMSDIIIIYEEILNLPMVKKSKTYSRIVSAAGYDSLGLVHDYTSVPRPHSTPELEEIREALKFNYLAYAALEFYKNESSPKIKINIFRSIYIKISHAINNLIDYVKILIHPKDSKQHTTVPSAPSPPPGEVLH